MIELLLQAERSLAVGLVDQADRLYLQAVAADPRNSIAVVGLARVALERGDDVLALQRAREALAIDPENVAAQRLVDRLEEVYAYRGESIDRLAAARGPAAATSAAGDQPAVKSGVAAETGHTPAPAQAPPAPAQAPPGAARAPIDQPPPATAPVHATPSPARQGRLDRLIRRKKHP